ncbi:MAG: methyltransferase [Bacteroidaceae bacterium]|nr:methyltransferase [Bacteroidaceae bacterium]
MFRFKKFEVWHDRCAMKVGTDGVLLGAWTRLVAEQEVFEIGCGSGVVSMILAQRFPDSTFTGVDIDEDAVSQCNENFEKSPFLNWKPFACCDVKQWDEDGKYTHIVSNPPFYDNALKSPDSGRAVARQTDALGFGDLLRCARRLLGERGCLSVIIPYSESEGFVRLASEHGFYPSRRTDVRTKASGGYKRTLLEFCTIKTDCLSDDLTINAPGGYSPEFIELTKDFYLDF